MQNLEGLEATPQIATVVKHQNVVVGKFISDEGANLQGKTVEEIGSSFGPHRPNERL